MTRTKKMVVLPDWSDAASVANFFNKILEDAHKEMFPYSGLARARYEIAIVKLSEAYYQACALEEIPEDEAMEMLRVVACLLPR